MSELPSFASLGRHVRALLANGHVTPIAKAALVTAIIAAFVKLASVARDLVLAWLFGTSDAVDAFLIAFLLPSVAINIIVGSFAAALIPRFVRVLTAHSIEAARKFVESGLAACGTLLVVVMLLLGVFGTMVLPWLASGFSPEKLALTQSLFLALLPTVPLQGFVTLWGALLNARKRFIAVAITPVVSPTLTVGLLLLMGERFGIHVLPIGLVLGSAIEAALLALFARQDGLPTIPRWHGYDTDVKAMVHQYGPIMAGALLMSGTQLVDQAMAAMLDPGSVAALDYGNKLPALILSLAAMPLGTVALPYFSEQMARRDFAAMHRSLTALLRFIMMTSVPAVLILVLMSETIVALIFQRGAFRAEDTALVAQVQACFLLQVPFYLAGILGVRCLSALNFGRAIFIIGTASFILNVTLNIALMNLIGLPGIALATSLVYVMSALMIFLFLRQRLRSNSSHNLMRLP